MISLENYGWNNFHQQNFNSIQNKEIPAARVVSIKGFKYQVIAEKGVLEAELSGKLLFGSESEDLPKVGDWVCMLDYGQTGYIIDVMPRTNALSRKNPGSKVEKQILAANVDYALIVQGMDRDFNINRLERYLAQVVACGITPIVVLNKADLVPNVDQYRAEVLTLKRDCKIYCCSTYTRFGIDELISGFEKFKTYVLVGSSGVGKSSLLNILMDEEVQKTGSTSIANAKGKHTTSTRDLFKLPNESLLIDTPGMREFGLTMEEGQDSSNLFPLIHELSGACRYSDCTHIDEADCAITAALQNGTLDLVLYESYVKLIKEQKRYQINVEDKKRLNKQAGKISREAQRNRKKYKF